MKTGYRMRRAVALGVALACTAALGAGDRVSLRLGGRDVPLDVETSARVAALARETLARCGPNTVRHWHNFGPAAAGAAGRHERTLAASRLHVAFAPAFETRSHLGGALNVTEGTIGLEEPDVFVGPYFTRDLGTVAEHLRCEYLPALELACLPALAPYLAPRYRESCALLERDASGRIVMPPPDVAPSCS